MLESSLPSPAPKLPCRLSRREPGSGRFVALDITVSRRGPGFGSGRPSASRRRPDQRAHARISWRPERQFGPSNRCRFISHSRKRGCTHDTGRGGWRCCGCRDGCTPREAATPFRRLVIDRLHMHHVRPSPIGQGRKRVTCGLIRPASSRGHGMPATTSRPNRAAWPGRAGQCRCIAHLRIGRQGGKLRVRRAAMVASSTPAGKSMVRLSSRVRSKPQPSSPATHSPS